jgi:hypothetical protein
VACAGAEGVEAVTRKTDHPASAQLRGIVHLIESKGGKPSASVLANIRQLAIDALDVLSNPDPRAQKIATVLLVLRQCTAVKTRTVNGKTIDRVTIIDQAGYGWAMAQVHALGA